MNFSQELNDSCFISMNQIDKSIKINKTDSIHQILQAGNSNMLLGSLKIEKDGIYQKRVIFHPSPLIRNEQFKQNNMSAIYSQPYLVIKYYRQFSNKNGYPLKIGDFFKLGQSCFRVFDISKQQKNPSIFHEITSVLVNRSEQKSHCKFCLCEEETESNPIISPCDCKGSCSGVHIQCLKKWINAKVRTVIPGLVTSLNLSKLSCQICKRKLSSSFTYKGKQMNLLTFQIQNSSYLILESIQNQQKVKNQKSFHILTPKQGESINIGRAQQSHVRIIDQTVSRIHSSIKLQNGVFYLRDKDSKFGTLVKLQNNFNIDSKCVLQMGKSLYQITPPF